MSRIDETRTGLSADTVTEPCPDPVAKPDGAPRPVWHLTVAYDGAAYHGWQVQPGVVTVQEILQEKLRRLFLAPELTLSATSRTDAGVHALDQQVSFPEPGTITLAPERIPGILNRWLPRDIRILRARQQPPEFHARHSACAKAYTYVMCTGDVLLPCFTRYTWQLPRHPLNLDAMRAAAAHLVGEHDFASFGVNPKRVLPTTVCHLYTLEIIRDGEWLFFNVLGSSFLYKMVRSLVGWLVQVGLGRRLADETPQVLAARRRTAAADTAPAEGLFLARVFFEANAWHDYRPLLPPFTAALPGGYPGPADSDSATRHSAS